MYKEDFISVCPKHELLKKFIPYYYFYSTYSSDFNKRFNYYPHYRLGLTVYKDSQVIWDSNSRTTTYEKGQNTVLLTKNIKTTRIARDYGIINKICIAFEPLGLNNFINQNLNNIALENISYFDYFDKEFIIICETVFRTSDVDKKVEILDSFFLRKYNEFSEKRIIKAIKLLMEASEHVSIQKLSELVGVNRKTMLRLFQKHLCCTPKAFRQTVKFRKAFNQSQESPSYQSLTNLAYDNNYYDQSGFINHIKQITGLTPKSLFSSIEKLSSYDIYWSIKRPSLSQITN